MLKNLKVGFLSITLLLSTKSVLGEETQNCGTQPAVCMTSQTKIEDDGKINVIVEDEDDSQVRSVQEEVHVGRLAKLQAQAKYAAKPGQSMKVINSALRKIGIKEDTYAHKVATNVIPKVITYFTMQKLFDYTLENLKITEVEVLDNNGNKTGLTYTRAPWAANIPENFIYEKDATDVNKFNYEKLNLGGATIKALNNKDVKKVLDTLTLAMFTVWLTGK